MNLKFKLLLLILLFYISSYGVSINSLVNIYNNRTQDSLIHYELEEDEEEPQMEYVDNRYRFFIRGGFGFDSDVFFKNSESSLMAETANKVGTYISPSVSVGFDYPITLEDAIFVELGFSRSSHSIENSIEKNPSDADYFFGINTFSLTNINISIPIGYRLNINQNFNCYLGLLNSINLTSDVKFASKGTYNQTIAIDSTFKSIDGNLSKYSLSIFIGSSIRLFDSNFLVDVRGSLAFMSVMDYHDSKYVLDNKINFNDFNGLYNLTLFVSLVYDMKFGQKNLIEKVERREDIFLNDYDI